MEHNRYLIYEMKGLHVYSNLAKRFGGYKLNGEIERVFRDVLEKTITFQIKNKKYIFREPNLISRLSEYKIIFIYGNINSVETTDDEIFEEIRNTSISGGNIDSALRELDEDDTSFVVFELKEIIKNEKKRKKRKRKTEKNKEKLKKGDSVGKGKTSVKKQKRSKINRKSSEEGKRSGRKTWGENRKKR